MNEKAYFGRIFLGGCAEYLERTPNESMSLIVTSRA